jgi:CRISPR/Cas system-associated endonuclease Cas1
LRSYSWRKRDCEEREKLEEAAQQAAAELPSPEVLDKILRYEAALERQLYRAVNQLERLQRRRQGENIPAPLTMEISARA